MKSFRFPVLVFILFVITYSVPLYSQEGAAKPRIAVKKLTVSDAENIQLQVISERVTDNTELVLKFMNEYDLTSVDFSGAAESEAALLEYCNKNNIDNIVYGKTYTGEDNSFVIEMSVYSRGKEQTVMTRTGTAETALDIFEASDKLTASIIEEFSGVHIAFGKIHLTGTGVEGSYQPFVDGEPFPENSSQIDNLLIGKRTVEIKQTRMLGETVIDTQEIIVKENSITELSFEIPHLLPAESEVIGEQDRIITKNWDKRKKKEKVTKAFNDIYTLLSDTPWNTSLAELREEYRKKQADYEADYAELMKTGTREFIVGASLGMNISSAEKRIYDDGDSDSDYDPVDIYDWNDESHTGPSLGINVQYQLFNNIYIQTEFNYKEIFLSEYGSMDNYIQMIEIPVLFKLTEQFSRHRFSMYMGPSFYRIIKAGGIFEKDYSSAEFTNLDQVENDIGIVMGFEYGYKKDRHLLTAGFRYTNLNILDYSYYNPDKNEDENIGLRASAFELILGYGYNLGGSGRIEKEEDRNKWLLAADAGFMIMLSMDENNTVPLGGFGFLKRITKNYYAGIRGFVFSEGGAPMLSIAYTKDPDIIIHNYSFAVFPIMDTLVGAFQYNIAFQRISLGIIAGGPLESMTDLGIGLTAGYYF